MTILAIDPGSETHGLVFVDGGEVVNALNGATMDAALSSINAVANGYPDTLVAIERVQSFGKTNADLIRTSENVGRLQQRALDCGLRVVLLYRREVLAALDVTGKGNRDALVGQRLIEMNGGTRKVAYGTKKAPGPLYGVTGHAVQALAVAVAAGLREEAP